MTASQGMEQSIVSIIQLNTDVLFAYLFGSRVKGTARANSDVDIAVYFATSQLEGQDHPGWLERQIDLALEMERVTQRSVDVVVLNEADVDMCQNILVHGRLLYCRDPKALGQFKLRQLRLYQDFIMMAPIFNHYRKKRIKEGRFGGRTLHGAKAPGHH